MTATTISDADSVKTRKSRANLLFIGTVVLPTLMASLYFGLVASDVYLSESKFVIRSPERQASSPLGMVLRGAGFTRSQDDSYTVQDFIRSRDALRALDRDVKIGESYADRSIDVLSRFAGLAWWDRSFEALYKYYLDKVEIRVDTASSIATLTTRGFTPESAQRINQRLLEMSEELINQLNARGRQDMVSFAKAEADQAEERARAAALALASYRDKKGVIDPERQTTIPLQQIAKLQEELIATKTQLAQVKMLTKENPQIPTLQKRVDTLEAEIAAETAKVAGGRSSLAGKAADYQQLVLEKEFADKQLASALASLEQARNDAARKQFYLERIAQPNLPDGAEEPHRLRLVMAVAALSLVTWGILSLLSAGIREHQE